ncbi:M24 family metallopeptidase [Chlorobium ferrooxidans]|uniref:Peptidase M24 n=1 Tax=Chlorobium ferrooxidans DSM 13031 TaxID=377431 RepID=Q0YU57_9CHLB|nr:aminopeptidase P family protein [Chlorobium ferrooxidans]EAT59697.1 Peptidase M24 [Chlorobium ferrooxidans DSM 13031]
MDNVYREAALKMVLGKMMAQALDACIVTDLSVIRWLTGFSGSSARMIVTREKSWLFTDFRYKEQAAREVIVAETVISAEGFDAELGSGRYALGESVALQSDNITWHEATRLIERLHGRQRVIPVHAFFDEFRMVKHETELMKMRRAAEISEAVLEAVLPLITPVATEIDIAAEISYQHKKLGAEKDSFDPIVAGGPRSAMPHAKPSSNPFKPGELIVIDMGCVYEGYASDQTRTLSLGRASEEARTVYRIVREAQELGIASATCGMTGKELDAIVRGYIAGHGYSDEFGHGLGHGVGFEVHEEPRISPKGELVLRENMVFTIEPGIYLPGRFGVRIEDTVVLGAHGAEPLQRFSKELIEL